MVNYDLITVLAIVLWNAQTDSFEQQKEMAAKETRKEKEGTYTTELIVSIPN